MAVILAAGLLPAVAHAATHSFDIGAGDILVEESAAVPGTLRVSVGGAVAQDGIDPADTVRLTGTTSANSVTVSADMAVNLELDGLSITGRPGNANAIDITGTTNATMTLTGTNTLDNGSSYSTTARAGVVHIAADATLTIAEASTGSIDLTANGLAPAIGGNGYSPAGFLVIDGGTIMARVGAAGVAGGSEAAMLGRGYNSSMKSIVINGGTITAAAHKYAAIGASHTEINGGTITASNNPAVQYFTDPVIGVSNGTTVITGGTVTATGSGLNLGGSTIRITGGSVTAAQGTFQTRPTNGAVAVYPAVLGTGSASTAVQPGQLDSQRTGLNTALAADPYRNVYGVSGVVSDASSNVTLWLPDVDIPVIDVTDHSAVLGYDDSGLPRTIAAGLDGPAELSLLNPSDFPAGATYQWLKNGAAIPGATSAALQVTERGDYTLQVTATGAESGTPVTEASQRTVSLTAQYAVDFDANGGFGYAHSQTKLVGTPLTLDANGYTRTGYTFAGWNTTPDGTGTPFADGAVLSTDFTETAGATVTLYAQWTPVRYWAQFAGNGADSGTMASQQITYGDATQTLSPNAYARTGYTFTGWNTAPDATGTPWADQASVSPDLASTAGATVSLFAQWAANSYTVSFDGNGATSGSMADQGLTYDDASQTLAPNAYARTGYTFTGWTTAPDGSGASFADRAAKPNASADPNGTVTLYAQWTANTYDIAFNGNGSDTGSMDPIETVWDAAVPVAAPDSAYGRTGYSFSGWNTKADGTGTPYAAGVDLRNLSPGDTGATVVLYAQWTATSYTVSFDGNGEDSGTMADQTLAYDTAADLDANAFGLTGHTFAGWSWTDPQGTVRTFADGESVLNLVSDGSTVNLVAQWRANSYAVSFDGNGATSGSMADQPMVYGTAADLDANAYMRGGHSFAGWNTAADGTGTAFADGESVSNLAEAEGATVVLFAQWDEHAPVLSVDAASYKRGDAVTVSGTGFEPGAQVQLTLHSAPVLVATLTAQADGTLAGSFAIPADAEAGTHTLVADDGFHTALVQLEVEGADPKPLDPADPSGGEADRLARAGDAVLPFAAGALALAAAGALALAVVRRRRSM